MGDNQDQIRRGRPKLSQPERRSTRIVAMVTRSEFCELQALAERSDMSMSALCQNLLAHAMQAARAGEIDTLKSTVEKDL